MARDGTLTRRILLTLAGVVALDAVLVAVLAFLVTPWLGPLRDPLVAAAGGGLVARGGAWLVVALPALAVVLALQIAYTRRELVADAGARPVGEAEYPDLHARLRRLSQSADVPTPAVAVVDSDVPNAFTVGGVRDATLVVSEGLLASCSPAELDAVLAHELAHVKNRDATVLTLAAFLPAVVGSGFSVTEGIFGEGTAGSVAVWLPVLAVGYLLTLPHTGGNPVAYLALVAVVVVIGGVTVGLLGIPAVVLSQRLARYREFGADRAAARVTGDPATMATLLERLDEESAAQADARTAYDGVDGLCLLPHGFGDRANGRDASDGGDDGDGGFRIRTRSHPPTEERVARLREVAAEMETSG